MPSILMLFLIISSICLSGCMDLRQRALSKTPEEIGKWSDEHLCFNAGWENPAIKSELLNRKLFTEDEYNNLFPNRDIKYFPRIGMSKCAMWRRARVSDLIDKRVLPNGTIQEVWKVSKGEVFFFFFGGFNYNLTFENDKLTNILEIK